jgi:hypothetical protein
MPISMENTVDPIVPNTVKYDLSIVSRISNGQLKVSVGVNLKPVKCEIVNGAEVYTECFSANPPVIYTIADLESYAAQHPELATQIMTAWSALSGLVASINAQEKLL